MSVTLTRFGTLVITRSSMLLPRVGSVNGVPEDIWQIKVTLNYHIVELVKNFM